MSDRELELESENAILKERLHRFELHDTERPPADTADLTKDAEIARKITEIHENVSQLVVPLRTDISELSTSITKLADALAAHTDNEFRIMARLTRIEQHLSLPPMSENDDSEAVG